MHLVKEVGAFQLITTELELCQWAVLPDGQGCIQDVLANEAFERRPQAEGLAHLLQTSFPSHMTRSCQAISTVQA